MNLLHFRKRTRDLHLPNGALVKVVVRDDGRAQNVFDQFDRVHATVEPDPVALRFNFNAVKAQGFLGKLGLMRTDRKPTQGAKKWRMDEDVRLWAPLPEDVLA